GRRGLVQGPAAGNPRAGDDQAGGTRGLIVSAEVSPQAAPYCIPTEMAGRPSGRAAMTDRESSPARIDAGPFAIRRLSPSDLALARRMNALFAEAFDDPETYEVAPPDDAWLTSLLAREHVAALVALAEGEVVGALVAYELDKFERARREFYIYDL